METNPNNGSWGVGPEDDLKGGGTKDFVQPNRNGVVWTQKAVYGYEGTASVGQEACSASVEGPDDQTYFPSPCLSDTRYSADRSIVDKWLLRTSNAGAKEVKELRIFDEFPVLGDQLLIGGANRGSKYRTVLAAQPVVHLPEGTVVADEIFEVTEQAGACQGTWEYLNLSTTAGGAMPCEQTTPAATWTTADDETDWSKVAGIRIGLTFHEDTQLKMGDIVDVTYETYNVIESDPDTKLSNLVPMPAQQAWNQFGIQWQLDDATQSWSQRIPAEVGVTPLAGPLQINKMVDGNAKEFAASSFEFAVSCSITQPGVDTPVALDLGANATQTVTKQDDGTYGAARIDGIPLGSVCQVVETDAGNATSTTVEPGSVTITRPAYDEEGEDGEKNLVPEAQIVTATNTYDLSGFTVTKEVTGAGAEYGVGPFDFTATCTFNGEDVELAGEGRFSLPTADDDWTHTFTDIPIGAECTVEETDEGGATSTTIVPASVTVAASTEPEEGEDPEFAAITVTNGFELGGLQITKELAGEGQDLYGTGPFTFDTVCTFEGAPVDLGDNASVSLPTAEGAWSTKITDIPVGASCVVTESAAGGATGSELYPNDGTVTIPAPGDGELPLLALVSATNTFDMGKMQLTKVVTGSGAEEYGDGPFKFETTCTYDKDGQPLSITLPANGIATLPVNDQWSVTYEDLIVGAECVTTETNAAGANSTAIDPENGTVVIPPLAEGQAQTALVTVTNTFEVGTVGIEKLVEGPFGLDSDELKDLAFTVSWTASNGESGTLELTEGSDWKAVTKDLPVGATVTFTEVDLPTLLPHVGFPGYTWVAGEGITVSEDGKQATVTVGSEPVQLQVKNSFELNEGTFEITKAITGDFSATSDEMKDREFTVTWEAGDRSGSIVLNAENGWTAGPGANFPVGSTVTLEEAEVTGLPPHVQFESATWTDAEGLTVNEDGIATLTVGEGDAAVLEITNDFKRLTGSFEVEKLIAGDFDLDAPEFDDVTFVVNYEVSNGESGQLELNRDGDWKAAAGQFPTGATVTLTEVAVDQGDLDPHIKWDGYKWLTGDGVTVSEEGLTATIVVGDDTTVSLQLENAFEELLGGFAVQKAVSGDFDLTDPQLSGLVFEVEYTASTGETGTLELSKDNGWTAAPTEDLRTGTTVTLTEVEPTGYGPSVNWGGYTWVAADGVTVSEDGLNATITIGDAETARLQVSNEFTEKTGNFAVEKLIEGDFAATDAEIWFQTFTVHYEATEEVTGCTWSGDLKLDADHDWKAELEQQLPAGTVVTLTEVDVADLPPHVQWDGYKWLAAEGVDVSSDGLTATFTIGSGVTTQLQVQNTFTELSSGFTVTKNVTGEGSDRVPGDFGFVAEYSVDGGDTWVALPAMTTTNPTVSGPDDLRLGTKVLIREIAPAALPSVTWGSPAFHGEGVEPGVGGAPSSFVITDSEAALEVQLTNPTDERNGQFSVLKKVTAPNLMVGDPLFKVVYTYEGQAGAGEFEVRNGKVFSSEPIPAGTKVTVKEITPKAGLVAGASWGTPVFVMPDGSTVANGESFTIQPDTVLSLVLENPADKLATTGAGGVTAMAILGAALLLGGAAIYGSSRRRKGAHTA